MILIYTNKEDVHPTRVIQHLKAWGVDVFRLNTECLLSDYEFDWQCFADGGDFHIRNICNNLELFSNQVTAIWDRRPEIPSKLFLSNEIEDVNRHILKEAHGFLNFLRYWMRDIYSIGSIVEDRPAASKMLQLMVANELGMKTPDTCFANRKGPIDKFASQYDDVLLKPISYSDILLGDIGQEYTFYAKKISSKAILNQPDERPFRKP